jgi:hypothetical protein
MAAVGFVVVIVVPILAAAQADAPEAAAFHPLSAVLVLLVLMWVEWRLRPMVIGNGGATPPAPFAQND